MGRQVRDLMNTNDPLHPLLIRSAMCAVSPSDWMYANFSSPRQDTGIYFFKLHAKYLVRARF